MILRRPPDPRDVPEHARLLGGVSPQCTSSIISRPAAVTTSAPARQPVRATRIVGRAQIAGDVQEWRCRRSSKRTVSKQRHSSAHPRQSRDRASRVERAPRPHCGGTREPPARPSPARRAPPFPPRPIGANRRARALAVLGKWRARRESSTIARRRIAIERRWQMTHPRALDSLAIEHAHENVRIRVRHGAKRIRADERVDVESRAWVQASEGTCSRKIRRKMRAALRQRMSRTRRPSDR